MRLWMMMGLLALGACTPAEQEYCERLGVASGNPEFSKCIGYYFEQTAAFNADRGMCDLAADQTYPRALYDTWKYERVHGGYYGGRYYSGYTVDIPPDYRHNQMVDALRMRIVGPCMAERGWMSPVTWEAGRAIATTKPRHVSTSAPKVAGKLPWLK